MNQKLLFRRMQVEDVPRVHQIDVESFSLPWPEHSYHYEITNNLASRPFVVETLADNHISLIVGMIVVWVILDEAHIGTIAVDPHYRQQGIAKFLLAKMLHEVYREGVEKVFLEVRRGNKNAQMLYERFGFTVDGVRKKYYKDNNEDALLMMLDRINPAKLEEILAQFEHQKA